MALRAVRPKPELLAWVSETFDSTGGMAELLADLPLAAGECGVLVSEAAAGAGDLPLAVGGAIVEDGDGEEAFDRIVAAVHGYLAGGPERAAVVIHQIERVTAAFREEYANRDPGERVPWFGARDRVHYLLAGPQPETKPVKALLRSGNLFTVGFLARNPRLAQVAKQGGVHDRLRPEEGLDYLFVDCHDGESWLLWACPGVALPESFGGPAH
jgi:hypothetical protein